MGENESHHIRFYVVLATLVVGGIFFFWYLNSNGVSLTGAFSGGAETEDSNDIVIDGNEIAPGNNYAESTAYTPKSGSYSGTQDRTVDGRIPKLSFKLDFSEVPVMNREVATDFMLINFNDFSTIIKINGGKLELSNLESAALSIEGFEGKMGFNGAQMSLNGKAGRVEINNIALSSANEISIIFDGLDYQAFKVENIGLKDLSLPVGTGQLTVDEKLTYSLDSDSLLLSAFRGSLASDKFADFAFKIDGGAAGIDTKGKMNLVLR